jgi:hypothetical protein
MATANQKADPVERGVSSALQSGNVGLGEKIAIAGTIFKLVRRYPVPALIVGGLVLALYLGRGHAHRRVTRH